jgi:hypothetical protein
MMDDYLSPPRLNSLRLVALAGAKTLAHQERGRRGKEGGATPAPVDPAPTPLPLSGGAEAAIE